MVGTARCSPVTLQGHVPWPIEVSPEVCFYQKILWVAPRLLKLTVKLNHHETSEDLSFGGYALLCEAVHVNVQFLLFLGAVRKYNVGSQSCCHYKCWNV